MAQHADQPHAVVAGVEHGLAERGQPAQGIGGRLGRRRATRIGGQGVENLALAFCQAQAVGQALAPGAPKHVGADGVQAFDASQIPPRIAVGLRQGVAAGLNLPTSAERLQAPVSCQVHHGTLPAHGRRLAIAVGLSLLVHGGMKNSDSSRYTSYSAQMTALVALQFRPSCPSTP
ncbi:hypothetical protein D555_1306 [Bordetella holmesii 35009]|nr:hypothetical protein D555_1306 [Bordetella holmesii 35009]